MGCRDVQVLLKSKIIREMAALSQRKIGGRGRYTEYSTEGGSKAMIYAAGVLKLI
jgi:hypothetical protein